MKKILFTSLMLVAFSVASFAAVTIHYYNKDSKSHTFKVKIDGSYKEITFDASKTSDVTIQGGARECIIYTSCGEVTIKAGDKIEIVNGCIKK
jgi:hypothetical protein